MTNSTGAAVEAQLQADTSSYLPEIKYSPLAKDSSISATDEWSGATGSSVFGRVKYPDGSVAEFTVANGVTGKPFVEVRTGPSTQDFDPDDSGYQTHDFGVNTSWSPTVAGHTVSFTRDGDDDDNKNWTVALK